MYKLFLVICFVILNTNLSANKAFKDTCYTKINPSNKHLVKICIKERKKEIEQGVYPLSIIPAWKGNMPPYYIAHNAKITKKIIVYDGQKVVYESYKKDMIDEYEKNKLKSRSPRRRPQAELRGANGKEIKDLYKRKGIP